MKRLLLIVVLAALLVLAGCSEGTTSTTPATSTDTPIDDSGTSALSGNAPTLTGTPTTTSTTPAEGRTATQTRPSISTATATDSAATNALPTSSQTTTAASTRSATTDDQGRQATVIRVVDGDTVEVEFADGTTDTIRLLGVDTPETTLSRTDPPEFEGIPDTAAGRDHLYNWGQRATQFASEQLAGQQVRVVMDPESDERGSYGRLLAYIVSEDGTNFNLELLRQGYARMYDSEFARRDEFASAEAQAQSSNAGLWDFDGAAATATATPRSEGESGSGSGVVTPTPSGPASDPYDCSDFDTRAQVEAVFDPDNDVSGLDSDGDGKACESL